MNSLNIGWWNSTKLNIFKLSDLKPNDLVISAKMKIMEMAEIKVDVEKLDLIYCGIIMENMDNISKYIKNNNALVFMVKNENVSTNETESPPPEDLQNFLDEFNEASVKPGFKEMMLSTITPETITELSNVIPELSEDLVALSIIKESYLFESILDPSVMKAQVSKHPALLMCVDYLLHNTMRVLTGTMGSSVDLTDEDFSESDDIETYYNTQNIASLDSDTFSLLDFSINGNDMNNVTPNEEDGNIFENVQMAVLDSHSNEAGQQLTDNHMLALSSQLYQMHEWGLFNDLLNLRALQMAEGNVQLAVELILNRVIQ